MAHTTNTVFDGTTGEQLSVDRIEVPDQPVDLVQALQAQVDALTDIVLGGGA